MKESPGKHPLQSHPAGHPIPVQPKERLEFVDVLRGFALFGVLAANMAGYSGLPRALPPASEPFNRTIVLLIRFLIEAKFYSLFALLFGWGATVQMARAQTRGTKFVPFYLKRLFWLLVFGLLHSTLLWSGDILSYYAVLGILLLFFLKRSPRQSLIAMTLLLCFTIVLNLPGEAMDTFRAWYQDTTSFLHTRPYPSGSYADGSYLEILALRMQDANQMRANSLYTFAPVLAMLLLGLYIGKTELFFERHRHRLLWKWIMWNGLFVGTIGNGLYALLFARPDLVRPDYLRAVQVGIRVIAAPAMMLFYVSGILFLIQQTRWRDRLMPLAMLGRMSLTHYLLQSVVCAWIFDGYGLGLYGEVGATGGLILTIVIYAAQIRFSQWWLERYPFGPMEWLWRTLTYGYQTTRRNKRDDTTTRSPSLARRKTVIWIVGITVVVLVTGALVFRFTRPKQTIAEVGHNVVLVTATPNQQQAEPTKPAETPSVKPVSYSPDPVAASGSPMALASTFDIDAALAEITTLTGAAFAGRGAGSPGGWAAGDYIAEQFARYGLQPIGDVGTFFQSFPIEYITLAEETHLAIRGPDGTLYDHYLPYQDFSTILRWYAGAGSVDAPVVWTNNCAREDFDTVSVVDKVVLCRYRSLQDAQRNAIEHGAAGLLLLSNPTEQYPPDFAAPYYEPWVPVPLPTLFVFPTVIDEMLLGSGKSAHDLSISFASFPLATYVRMTVSTIGSGACARAMCQGRNVLGVLPGRDPDYADQVLILGAHYDHMGRSPNGTTWAGANDNASGTAVLLEVAHMWHEHGYVPRHTVIFAAWDAEEKGLIGSSYYVQHPRYPLENTVAMLQLDMVGAGSETLVIDGDPGLAEQIRVVAESLGVETINTNSGRSDHAPFLAAGCAANLLIWDSSQDPTYHRPTDTIEHIDPDRMSSILKIVNILLLGMTEGEPAIQELIAQRVAAVESNDIEAFVDTSLSQQQDADRAWFLDLQTLSPSRFAIKATRLDILGDVATARIAITVDYLVEQESRKRTASMAARFVHTENGWKWGGPELTWSRQEVGMTVASSPGNQTRLDELGQQAALQYADIAALLGLPPESDSTLMVFPDAESLRTSTALSLPPGQDCWVGPSTVKLVYRKEISSSIELSSALTQLVLANAGVTQQTTPWLWDGLPLVLQAQRGESTALHIQALQRAFAEQDSLPGETQAWAAVEYLRQQLGWQGLGRLVTAIGQSCLEAACQDQDDLETILTDIKPNWSDHPDHDFETTWQTYWQNRIAAAQTALDTLLNTRTKAILSGDKAAFMRTVDQDNSYLQAEQQQWFIDLSSRHPMHLASSGVPLALHQDGSILAWVTMEYGFEQAASETFTWQVQFNAGETGLLWAGTPFELLASAQVQVYYAQELEPFAQELLTEAQMVRTRICTDLKLECPKETVIQVYDTDDAFQSSIPLSVSETRWLSDWAQTNESLKLRVVKSRPADAYRSTLTILMSRHLLRTSGVETEWLLRGIGLYLAQRLDGGQMERQIASDLAQMREAVINQELNDPASSLPAPHMLTQEQIRMTNAQTWDMLRFLVQTLGWDKLIQLVHSIQQGLDLEMAWQTIWPAYSFAEFRADWMLSLENAHVTPYELEIARAFDAERAQAHIAALVGAEFAGRQAGSPGAEKAADYIMHRFEEYGLMPAAAITPTLSGQTAVSFFQHFPISYTTLMATPGFEIVDENGKAMATLIYRQDFTLPRGTAFGGAITGQVILIHTSDYGEMYLDGKIALRLVSDAVENEVAQAIEHGAGGLILLDKKTSTKSMLSKAPFPVTALPEETIPVLMLSNKGYDRLFDLVPLEIANALKAGTSLPALPLGLEVHIDVPLCAPKTVESANVLGLLPGADPLFDQVVIIGAHYDHVGDDPDRRYSGQNDNASGIALLLEIARLWHETDYRPQRSVLFAAWGAQEPGEIGSRYYVAHPALPLTRTVAAIHLDAVGGGDGFFLQVEGTPAQEGLLRFGFQVAEERVDGRLALAKPSDQGDHLPFRERGVPSTLVAWRDASEENLPDEMADQVEPYRLGVAGRMVIFALVSIAK
ncbi:MAG: M20/M25/M40 family metallo-hydrolase [Anaerolineae bacterium]|nr:M20/M25/M40 family metallo-hydrolase [Anaerolineae bacterium]